MDAGAAVAFRVSERVDSGFFGVGQAPDCFAERNHRQPNVGSLLLDSTS
jgi:hypothetical protein